MTYTKNLNLDFAKSVVSADSLLDYSVDWIRDNLSPDDVYDRSTLEEWALNNGFVEDEE